MDEPMAQTLARIATELDNVTGADDLARLSTDKRYRNAGGRLERCLYRVRNLHRIQGARAGSLTGRPRCGPM